MNTASPIPFPMTMTTFQVTEPKRIMKREWKRNKLVGIFFFHLTAVPPRVLGSLTRHNPRSICRSRPPCQYSNSTQTIARYLHARTVASRMAIYQYVSGAPGHHHLQRKNLKHRSRARAEPAHRPRSFGRKIPHRARCATRLPNHSSRVLYRRHGHPLGQRHRYPVSPLH